MKSMVRNVAAFLAAGILLSVAACGGAPAKPADADDATATEGEEKPKKALEKMKGDKMEKADAEEE